MLHGIYELHGSAGDRLLVMDKNAPTPQKRTFGMVVTERQLGNGAEPSLADLSAALTEVYGTDFGIHDLTWISRFTDATLQATDYRRGRVLIAGDAAHGVPGAAVDLEAGDPGEAFERLHEALARRPDDAETTYNLGIAVLKSGDVETAITFFAEGVAGFKDIPASVHSLVFQLCSRQITLSSPIAIETLHKLPALSETISDTDDLASVLEVAAEISRRSAKHSAEFLRSTPEVLERLRRSKDPAVTKQAIELAAEFAARAGGIAADAWTALPGALAGLKSTDATKLMASAVGFLERGGGSALQVLITGGEILRTLPEIFDDWIKLLWTVAKHGNASLVAFVRSSSRFVSGLARQHNHDRVTSLALSVIKLTNEIAEIDSEAALACFRSSSSALRTVSVGQFEEWARLGLTTTRKDARARRSYFALETRGSHDALRSANQGLALDSVSHILRLYVEGLTGKEVEVSSLAAVPVKTASAVQVSAPVRMSDLSARSPSKS